MNFFDLAKLVIQEANQPLSPIEVWERAVEMGLDKQLNSKGKTPWATLGARLYTDVLNNPESIFEPVGKNPKRFGLRNITLNQTSGFAAIVVESVKIEKFTGRDLHPLLVKFADSFYHFRGAKLKSIFHEHSVRQKKGYNKWIHPDLVGVYFSFNDRLREYEKVIIDFQNDFSITSTKLFSFELKIRVDISNLREYYFQAVSNSSWANEGYLVALKLDEEVIEEARRLSHSFGIGLIRLDAENIEEGQILVPSTYRKEVDIDSMDRIASENRDFAAFLQNIIDDKKIKKVNSRYDKVMDDSEISDYLSGKGVR